MRKLILLSIIVGLVYSCGSGDSSNRFSSGDKIYGFYCTQCHGNTGSLQLNGATNFRTSKLSLEERIDVITNGRKTMLPYKGQLSPAQIKAVANYTLKFNETN